jgi:hypothetical protein
MPCNNLFSYAYTFQYSVLKIYNDQTPVSILALQELCILMVNRIEMWNMFFKEKLLIAYNIHETRRWE